MKPIAPDPEHTARPRSPSARAPWVVVGLCALVLFLALFRPKPHPGQVDPPNPPTNHASSRASSPATPRESVVPGRFSKAASTPSDAAAVVAAKLSRFAQSRRDLARALAVRKGIEFPAAAERFFAAVESGDWSRIEAEFNAINGGDSSAGHASTRAPEIAALWPAIIDAYGVAEQVHLWPARQLLDYGTAILDSLRPGMVYVGGTDHGRWIPELLNETTDGERHLVVTQNAFADHSYLDYLRLQYGERLVLPTDDDAAAVFQEYVSDAQRRFEHDRDFPDEPKQLQLAEEVRLTDGRVQISGPKAVMSINEKLLRRLLDKNPGTAFALEESLPMNGTYANAVPLGPLMELGVDEPAKSFTAERATQTLDYWRTRTQTLLADPEAAGSPSTLKSWSHDANATANLLAAHQFTAEAEQSYLLAKRLWPENPEAVAGLAEIYRRSGRATEAANLIQDFQRDHPDQREALEKVAHGTQAPKAGN